MNRSLLRCMTVVLAICVTHVFVLAQGTESQSKSLLDRSVDSAGVANARVDYAVPDAPAFKILGTEPSNIMRPSTVRELGVAISAVNAKGGAIEVSPSLLIGNPTLSSYRDSPFWHRLRVSAGAQLTENGNKDYGIGLRMTFIDDADLRTDPLLTDALIQVGHQLGAKEIECSKSIQIDPVLHPEEWARAIDSCLTPAVTAKYDSIVEATRESAKRRNWNKTLWEMGLAELASTPDSSVKRLQAQKYGMWSTLALPLFSTRGQILVGLRALVERDSDNVLDRWNGSVVVRGYYGKNDVKGFAEGDWDFRTHAFPTVTASLGVEFSVGNGIWVEGFAGLSTISGQGAKFTTGLNLRFGTPESKLK